jgi:uncharacterized protein
MTRDADRIASLDVLRGLGVLGILAVNAGGFALPFMAYADPSLIPLDAPSQLGWGVMHVLFERKFVTLFSLLFGASVLLVGGQRGDPVRGPVLKRRLFWLGVFGVVHGVAVWFGDILLLYAVAGALAATCRSWSPTRLFLTGTLLCLAVAVIEAGGALLPLLSPEAKALMTPPPTDLQAEIDAYRAGLASAALQNLKTWGLLTAGSLLVYLWTTWGLMLIGMGLLKTGVFQGRAHPVVYVLFAVAGLAGLGVIGWTTWEYLRTGMTSDTWKAYGVAANAVLAPVATLGYLGIIVLLLKGRLLRGATRALADVGQMAFTNYITQSLIMTTIFWSGRGFGLFGQLSRAELWALVVAVWVLQIAWSRLWMAGFRYGPLEWVWRRLSYARPVAIRRA